MLNFKIKQNKTGKVHLEKQDIKMKKTRFREKSKVGLTVESSNNYVTKVINIGGLKVNKLQLILYSLSWIFYFFYIMSNPNFHRFSLKADSKVHHLINFSFANIKPSFEFFVFILDEKVLIVCPHRFSASWWTVCCCFDTGTHHNLTDA